MHRNFYICLVFFCSLFSFTLNFADQSKNPVVVFETSQGMIELILFPSLAPKTCENFLKLVESGYYNNTTFHRVIKNFMIQGGDPLGNGTGGQSIWGKPFEDEFSKSLIFNRPGLLAMANRGPNTNGSQFFITTAITGWLNHKHTIFGEVTKGYDIVQKIENSPTSMDRPLTAQIIQKAYVKS